MNIPEFHHQLRTTGHYASPKGIRHFHLPSCLATPIFNLCMAEIFITGSVHSRRPGFIQKEWPEFGLRFINLVERLGGYIEIEGFENMQSTQTPVVWVSNHVSSLETYLLPGILTAWPGLMIVLKEPLAHYPFFGEIVRAVDPIRLLRQNPIEDLRKVLKDGSKGLAEGRSALIFPQGARYRQFDATTLNTLGTKLALHAKRPVVPLAVSTNFLRIGQWHRDLFATVHPEVPVRIACGPQIPYELGAAEIQRRTLQFITDKLTEWEQRDSRPLLALPTPQK